MQDQHLKTSRGISFNIDPEIIIKKLKININSALRNVFGIIELNRPLTL